MGSISALQPITVGLYEKAVGVGRGRTGTHTHTHECKKQQHTLRKYICILTGKCTVQTHFCIIEMLYSLLL